MYVISYDISVDRIRNKVAKELNNYGKRVQYSVFECDISAKQKDKLYKELLLLISEDSAASVRFYYICGDCKQKLQIMGNVTECYGLTKEEEDFFII